MRALYFTRETDIVTVCKDFLIERAKTVSLSKHLTPEDAVAQSACFASPAKWHLAHTSWFFDKFILEPFLPDYKCFDKSFNTLFNSYYKSVSQVFDRNRRGLITRPGLKTIYKYREQIDQSIINLLNIVDPIKDKEVLSRIILGINHEQQHQELLLTDIKHLFFMNPGLPAFKKVINKAKTNLVNAIRNSTIEVKGGVLQIGARNNGDGFHFDNESPRHEVFLNDFEISSKAVTNRDYCNFINDDGYNNPLLWLSDGWDKKVSENWDSPLYWQQYENEWHQFTLCGLKRLDLDEPVCHISFYEADAYCRWAGQRLPTESEWEIASLSQKKGLNFLESEKLHPQPEYRYPEFFGNVWEWTSSGYSPYPNFQPRKDGLGEYNGKFMINQIVLKGGSCLTPSNHIRSTYRNFFYPGDRWQLAGFRTVSFKKS